MDGIPHFCQKPKCFAIINRKTFQQLVMLRILSRRVKAAHLLPVCYEKHFNPPARCRHALASFKTFALARTPSSLCCFLPKITHLWYIIKYIGQMAALANHRSTGKAAQLCALCFLSTTADVCGVSRPLPDTGYMTGIGTICAVSIKKDRYYKNFREQDMA